MKKIKGIFSFFYKCFACYTLVVYALLFWIPFSGWFSGFIMMTFPIVFAAHVFFLLLSLFTNRKNIILPLALIIIGCVFLPRTFAVHLPDKTKVNQVKKPFKIMSYNVHSFMQSSDWKKDEVKKEIANMKNWIETSGADILCMPEYYNFDKAASFKVNREFTNSGYKHSAFLNVQDWNKPENYWGMAIFSKFPIIAMEDTLFMSQNGMVRADVKVGDDTIRIISIHMYSMTLKLDSLKSQRTAKGILKGGKSTSKLIKKGFTNHAQEMDMLESWIKASPHPVIACGDFNETPYSYVYGKARSLLSNSFEEKGRGFGFTYNHLPYFIRIDHQFYDSEKLNLIDFKTVSTIKYSDHYPLIGTYQFKAKSPE